MSPEENYQENPNSVIIGADPAAGMVAAIDYVYDATAQQRVPVEIEGESYVQVYDPFDDVLAEYDRLREVNLSDNGDEQELETASEIADDHFFEEKCVDIEDFGGEKTEGWKAEIELDERQAGVRHLLAVKIVKNSDEPKAHKKRTFGVKRVSNNRITLLSKFNRKEVETVIIFAEKLPSDISQYNRLKARIGLKEGKGFDESKIKIPAQIVRKAEIAKNIGRTVSSPADYIGYSSEGYRNGIVPKHHLALAVTAYFDRTIKTNQKK